MSRVFYTTAGTTWSSSGTYTQTCWRWRLWVKTQKAWSLLFKCLFLTSCFVFPVTSRRRTWRRRECSTPPTSESCWRASGSSNRNKLYPTGPNRSWYQTRSKEGRSQLNWTELERANRCQTVPSERNCTLFVLSKKYFLHPFSHVLYVCCGWGGLI